MKKILSLVLFCLIVFSMFGVFVPQVRAASFSVSVSPSSRSVVRGNTVDYTVSVSWSSGSGTVSLSLSGLPLSVGIEAFSPSSSSSSSWTSTLTIGTFQAAPTGSYSLTVTGTSGSVSSSASCTLTVDLPPDDYLLSASPTSRSVTAGGSSTTYAVTATLQSGSPSISLSLYNPPIWLTWSFSPGSGSPTFSSTLTVSASQSAPVGSHSLYVRGEGGGQSHMIEVTLNVEKEEIRGPPGTYVKIVWEKNDNYNFDLDVEVTDAPEKDVQVLFWAHQFGFVDGEGGYIGLQIVGSQKKAIFSIWGAIDGTPGGFIEEYGIVWRCLIDYEWKLNHKYRLRIWELEKEQNGDEWWIGAVYDYASGTETTIGKILVAASWGWLTSYSITWVEYAGYNDFNPKDIPYTRAVFSNLYARHAEKNGAPGKLRVSYGTSPSSNSDIDYYGGTTYALEAGDDVTRDTSEGWLTVEEESFDFSVSVSPSSQDVVRGYTVDYMVTVTPLSGSGTVSLSLSGLPSNVGIGDFDPESGSPSFSSTLTIGTFQAAPTGSYTLTVTGEGGGISRSDSCTLVVVKHPFDFLLSTDQSSRTVHPGESAIYTININLESGDPEAVTLSLHDPPSWVSYSFSPSSDSPTFTSTLTVTASSSAPVGSHSLYVRGDGGGQSRMIGVMLVVEEEFKLAISSLRITNDVNREGCFVVGEKDKIAILLTDANGDYVSGAHITMEIEHWSTVFNFVEIGNGEYLFSEEQVRFDVTDQLEIYDIKLVAKKEGYLPCSLTKRVPSLVPALFNIEPVSGWAVDPQDYFFVKVDGILYIAFSAVEDPIRMHRGIASHAWLILDEDGHLINDAYFYRKASLTAEVALITEGAKGKSLKEALRKDANYWRELPTYVTIAEAAGKIRDFASELGGIVASFYVTAPASLVKVINTATFKTMSNVLTTALDTAKKGADAYRYAQIVAAFVCLKDAANKADQASDILDGGEALWDYDLADRFYFNYREAILTGMESMVLCTEVMPDADVYSQVTSILTHFASGVLSVELGVYELIDIDEPLRKAIEVRGKFSSLFEPADMAYTSNADKVRQSFLGYNKIANADQLLQEASAVESGNIGASLTIEVTSESGEIEIGSSRTYSPEVTIETQLDYGKIIVKVSSEISQGKTMIINIDDSVLLTSNMDEVQVTYDGEGISLADNYADILNPNDEERPEYLILKGAVGLQVLISIPQFSTHTIEVRSLAVWQEDYPMIYLGVIALIGIACAILLASFVWVKKSKKVQS